MIPQLSLFAWGSEMFETTQLTGAVTPLSEVRHVADSSQPSKAPGRLNRTYVLEQNG